MIKTGNKNFWRAQTLGWGFMALSNLTVQIIGGFSPKMLLYNSIIPFTAGLLITTLFRYKIKKYSWKKWPISKLILTILGSSIVQTLFFIGFLFYIVNPLIIKDVSSLAAVLSNTFIFGIIFLAWNTIYFCVQFANSWQNSEVEKWKLIAEMKDAQLGSLKSQINPHFVFNALNNIRSLILEDKEKARDMLVNFSDLFRYSLKHTDISKVKLEQELEVVNQYLELLSIQFEEKLNYTYTVDDSLLNEEIPPMILQILIENAVKHGISQFKEGGIINLDIFKANGFIQLELKNTGSLKSNAALGEKLGIGLENIKERLKLLYDGNAVFNLKESQEFVIATVKIPLV